MIEKTTEFLSRIFEGFFWKTLLSQVNWVDWFTLGFIILGVVYGSRKGFMREIVEILELFLVIFLSYDYKGFLFSFLRSLFPKMTSRMLEPTVLMLSFIFFALLIAFIDRYLQKIAHAQTAAPLKIIGGGLLGAMQFMLVWSLISQVLILAPYIHVAKAYEKENSVSGKNIETMAPAVYQALTQPAEFFSGVKAKA